MVLRYTQDLPVSVSISTVKSPESRDFGGGKLLRSWVAFRFSRVSALSKVSRLPTPRSFAAEASGHWEFPPSRVTVNSVRHTSWSWNRSQTASIAWNWKSRLGSKWSFMGFVDYSSVGTRVVIFARGASIGQLFLFRHPRYPSQGRQQCRDIILNDVPDDIVIDPQIPMYDTVVCTHYRFRQGTSGWASRINSGIWVAASPISSRFRKVAS